MDREQSRYNIKFNHPDDQPKFPGNNEFKYNAVIDSKKTL